MAAEDELALPQVPEAKPNDPEDVSWALSTAEAMWARGDHSEGIKWVFKAAEAAAEVEDDNRALELAKSASDLTSLIARRSRASHGEGPGPAGPTPEPAPTSTPPTSAAPSTTRSQIPGPASAAPPAPSAPPARAAQSAPPAAAPAPQAAQAAQSPSRPPPVPSSGRPPAMPSRPPPKPASSVQAPAAAPSSAPSAPPPPVAPVAAPSSPAQPPRAAPRPLATSDARQGPQAGRGILSNRTAPSPAVAAPVKNAKGRRRSRENLEGEARAAGVLDTAPHAPVDGATAQRTLDEVDKGSPPEAVALPAPFGRARRRSRPEPEATVVARMEDLAEREKSAEEWDAHPTQNLTGDELNRMRGDGDRNTTTFAQPVAAVPVARPPSNTVHDPEIQTSQAVRVVVWRDATGVHVAPAGTVVSSITIDAVLVVLEPSADLTAWLSQRER